MYYKQSTAVLALFLASTEAKAPANDALFATGMNGDEDMGEDITMKGEKFHYIDKTNVQLSPNLDPEAGEAEKVSTLQTPSNHVTTTAYAQISPDMGAEAGGAEKVHVLDPGAHRTAANARDAFPDPYRTAFYAQQYSFDNENGLWRQNLAQEDPSLESIAGADKTDQVSRTTQVESMKSCPPNPDIPRSATKPAFSQKAGKTDPIGVENVDDWVHDYSSEHGDVHPQWHQLKTPPPKDAVVTSQKPTSLAQGPIIGMDKMEDEVHGFSSDATHGLAEMKHRHHHKQQHKHHHKHHSKKHHRHHKRDVAERGMDEEVHGFTKENLPPLTEWERRAKPYAANGSDPSSHDSSLHQSGHKKHHHHSKHDVAERKMDEEVHGFTAHNSSPIAEERRSGLPHLPNGSDASAQDGGALHQRKAKKHHKKHHRDVAERGMDEEVHGFTKENLPPLTEWERRAKPYAGNGSDPSAHDASLGQHGHKKHHRHHKHDVAERKMDEEVHGFSAEYTSPIAEERRSAQPHVPNGSDATSHAEQGHKHRHHKRHHHGKHHKKENIGSDGIDGQVQGWTSSQNVIEALPGIKKPTEYDGNGSAASAHPSLAQGGNIAEPSMHDYVHGLTSGMNVVEAMPEIRKKYPYWGEGSLSINPGSFAQSERGIYDLQRLNQVEKRDIASRGMDDNVHAAAAGSNVVEAIPQGRQAYSYNNNGWLNTAQVDAAPEQKKDIRNTNEVRPDVWHVVHDSISSTPLPRPKEAPAKAPEWAEYKPAKGLPEEKPKKPVEEEKDADELKAAAAEKAAATAAKIKADKAAEDAADDADAAKGTKPSKKAAAADDAKDDKKKDDKKDGEEEKKDDAKEEKKDDAKADAKPEEAKADAKADAKDAKPEEAKADAPKADAKADAPAKFTQKTAVVQKKEAKVEAKPAEKKEAKQAEKKPEAKPAEKKEDKPSKKSFLMMEDDEQKPVAPEKVHILEPHEYKEKADTNSPNIRTTFYDKKNGVWRQGDQM